MSLLTRLSFNSTGWQRPTGDASKLEEKETFNALHRFGFEDWFFRGEWQIDGWRYAFLQGANIKGRQYIGRPWNVTLYTIQPDKKRRWVANVRELECLDEQQSLDAEAFYRNQGWLRQMEEDVRVVGGDPATIQHTSYSGHFLNVRYRVENLQMMPEDTFWPHHFWTNLAAYYKFYALDAGTEAKLATLLPAQGGRDAPLPEGAIFRRGVAAVKVEMEHRRMQARLLTTLQAQYGTEKVRIEVDGIDVRVQTDTEIRIYEIKSDLNPRSVIRQALGQILEYGFHPSRVHPLPLRLVIVGRSRLEPPEQAYLDHLTQAFGLPLEYLPIPIRGS